MPGFLLALVLAAAQAQAGEGPRSSLPHLVPAPDAHVRTEVELRLELGSGWEMNEKAPSNVKLFQGKRLVVAYDRKALLGALSLPKLDAGKTYRLQGTIYFCEVAKKPVCVIQSHDQKVVADGSDREIRIELKAPKR